MRFTEEAIAEMQERLVQLGLSDCKTCSSARSLLMDKRPMVLNVGTGRPDLEPSEIDWIIAVRVECNLCGQMVLFNVQRFYGGDDPIFETSD